MWNLVDKIIAWMSKQPEDRPWNQTWQGALFTLGFSQLPGGCRRFQEWDEFIKSCEDKQNE